MTNSLLIGPAATLVQSTVYALPARQVRIQSTIALETSIDNSTWTAVAASTTGVDVTAVFARCTTGAAVVVCRV
jgi:hypothetical protein